MFGITAVLWCDGKGCVTRWSDAMIASETLLRRDLEIVRAAAAVKGWRRLRPKGSHHYGDYCPACVEKIRPGK